MRSGDSRDHQVFNRRSLLQGGAAAALAFPAGIIGAQAFPGRGPAPGIDFAQFPLCKTAPESAPVLTGPARKLKFSWNSGASCLTPLPVALAHGFFTRQNLDVELVNYSGSTDQLLEAIATGKSDAGVGMALRWLKPLEQGFDVKITAGTHGGCMRVLSKAGSGVDVLADLKGKSVGVGDLAGPDKNFFSVLLAKQGIDPNKDVDWRAFPGDLLRLAVEKNEVQAFLSSDPLAFLWLKDKNYKQVASNLDGEYANRTCCIVGVRGSLLRDEPLVARALTQAYLDASMFTAQYPGEAAAYYLPYAPKSTLASDVEGMLRSHTHHHHPTGETLKEEIRGYAEDLKIAGVFKPSTNAAKYAGRVVADVFA